MRFYRLLFAILALYALSAPLDAQHRGSGSSRGSAHVRGYTRRDGTHVAPYTRSAPRSYAAPRRPRSYSAPSHPRSYTTPSHPRSYATPKHRAYTSPNAHGRIPRSRAAKDDFMRRSGYPHGRSGYVVDHIVPLCAGGADAPSNMQWQTIEDGKAKDRQERATCSARRH